MPEVPTFAELGRAIPELDAGSWFGHFAAAGVPADVVAKLNADVLQALGNAGIRPKLIELGFVPAGSRPEEAAVFLAEESKRWPPPPVSSQLWHGPIAGLYDLTAAEVRTLLR